MLLLLDTDNRALSSLNCVRPWIEANIAIFQKVFFSKSIFSWKVNMAALDSQWWSSPMTVLHSSTSIALGVLAAVTTESLGPWLMMGFGWQQQAALFILGKLPLSLYAFHIFFSSLFLSLVLQKELVHMVGSLASGWLRVPKGGISLPDWQLNKQIS